MEAVPKNRQREPMIQVHGSCELLGTVAQCSYQMDEMRLVNQINKVMKKWTEVPMWVVTGRFSRTNTSPVPTKLWPTLGDKVIKRNIMFIIKKYTKVWAWLILKSQKWIFVLNSRIIWIFLKRCDAVWTAVPIKAGMGSTPQSKESQCALGYRSDITMPKNFESSSEIYSSLLVKPFSSNVSVLAVFLGIVLGINSAAFTLSS